jgi:very-short-patch-repair endonuclease
MHNELFNKPELKDRRRSLRNEPTRAEKEMWNGLRKKRTAGYKFRRQHSIGPFIVDFYCPALSLVVEVDGATHDDPRQKEYDARRTQYFDTHEIDVLRFTDGEVLFSVDICMEKIMKFIESKTPSPFQGKE